MGWLIAIGIACALGAYAIGRRQERARQMAAVSEVQRQIALADAAAQSVEAAEKQQHASEARERLEQASGDRPFDREAAKKLLADAGVLVVKK